MQMLINGQRRNAADGKVIEVCNMATMEVIDTVPNATIQDAQEALDAAVLGAKAWAAVPNYKRVELIEKFNSIVKSNRDELARLLCAENGKPLQQAYWEIDSIPFIFSGFAEESKHLFGETIPLDIQPGLEKDLLITKREPLGIVVAIVPFNFPAELFAHKAAAALVSGNVLIVKPPEDTPLTILRLVEMLYEAGIPGNAVQAVTGEGSEVGGYLVKSPQIQVVSFTGSTAVGTSIYQSVAKNLSRAFLELGGNDPLIVCEDGDVEQAVLQAVDGRLLAAGQVCCTNKRFLVHRSVHRKFKQLLVDRLSKVKIGNPMDDGVELGPLVNEAAAIRVVEQIEHTVRQGAELVYGGKRIGRAFVEPTVLDGVTGDMDIAKDLEVFGPVFPLIVFDSLDEALNICNQSIYGLNSGVFTKDIQNAFKVANAIETGMVSINGGTCYRPFCSAFGGYKKSGIGREGSAYTLHELTQIKSIVFRGVM